MTTIAFRHGVLASDSMVSSNNMHEGQAVKIRRIGKVLVGAAGSGALAQRFADWVKAGMKGDSPYHGSEDGNGLLIAPGARIVVFGQNGCWTVDKPFYALGSGEQIATGAMEMGASAEQAVACAIKHDIYTGGAIRVLKL